MDTAGNGQMGVEGDAQGMDVDVTTTRVILCNPCCLAKGVASIH
jgi:hypothetical protein